VRRRLEVVEEKIAHSASGEKEGSRKRDFTPKKIKGDSYSQGAKRGRSEVRGGAVSIKACEENGGEGGIKGVFVREGGGKTHKPRSRKTDKAKM